MCYIDGFHERGLIILFLKKNEVVISKVHKTNEPVRKHEPVCPPQFGGNFIIHLKKKKSFNILKSCTHLVQL